MSRCMETTTCYTHTHGTVSSAQFNTVS